VWERLHRRLLDRLGERSGSDWLGEGSLDSASVAAPGSQRTGPNPTNKRKAGSKRHIIVDREGVPLAVIHTAANVHDSKVLEEVMDAIEPIRKPRGRPRKRPKKLHAYAKDMTSWSLPEGAQEEGHDLAPRSARHIESSGWDGIGGRLGGRCRG
jgi:DDE family transposase